MILGIDFVIIAGLLTLCLVPLYIYREKMFSPKHQKDDGFYLFLMDLKNHMKQHHPKINIDYSIIEKTKNEEKFILRETIIVEHIIEQFFDFKYEKRTQSEFPRDKYWGGYEDKSKSNAKYPIDWSQRKEYVYSRQNKSCDRCGEKLLLSTSHTVFVKEPSEGGGYNLENVIILCSDCNIILNAKNPKNAISSLSLNDKLMIFVKS